MSIPARPSLPLDQIALGFLMAGPAHGYDLHRRIARELGPVWRVGMGHLYNALRDLERAGRVQSTLTPQADRPPRKVYAVTPAGQEAFLDWVHRPVPAVRDLRTEFLAKLYFLRAGPGGVGGTGGGPAGGSSRPAWPNWKRSTPAPTPLPSTAWCWTCAAARPGPRWIGWRV